MNERIEKLANQAGAIKYEVDFQRNSYPVNLEELQKFAELIVRECATLAFDGPNGILEHFGVDQGHPEEACDDEECYDVNPDW